ncbi:MAG: DNA polymerase III subunit beta [Candidatus Niyogibacteria bacterium]|nr:DNA polymerase III subunit beta [Candidatus Niyogibacteria bacterium]
MDFICSRIEFAKGLKLAEHLADRVSTIPALQGILLETNKNTVIIRSTDLNTGFQMTVPVREMRREGSAVIPVRPTIQLVSSAGGDTVHVEAEDSIVHFATHTTTSTLKGYPKDDFPTMPKIKNGEHISVPIESFLKAAHSVLFAAARSDIRPEIASVLIRGFSDGLIKIAATDSFRLAERAFTNKTAKQFSFLFPWRRLGEFIRILENFSGSLDCVFDSQQFFVDHQNFSYFTRLTEGKFPDYEQVIPRSFTTEVTANRTEFLEHAKLAGIFSGQMKEMRFKVYPADGLLEIRTTDSEIGEHSSRMKADITGSGLEMSFNQRYVVEGLDPLLSETVLLRFSGSGRPLVIQNPQDVSYIYLVMPMKSV